MFYAQRGEDEKLRQLIGSKRQGFYIDVGAWDPTADSVTKHFYDDGWHGINIEPVPYYFDLLCNERPRDVNLQIAISNKRGRAEFAHIHGTGLSTFVAEYRDKFAAGRGIDTLEVTVLTLAEVCEAYVPANQDIDFLKIDVEGSERHVIEGNDWTRFRPRVLCIEATEPGTEGATAIPAWESWDHLVRDASYHFLVFDGLNRWYRRIEN
jgi:FkbM family methyltransferase